MPGEIGQPMSPGGVGQGGARPPAIFQTPVKMGADRFLAALNPGKMAVWTHGDDKTAAGTAIAFKIEEGSKPLKKPRGETVAVEPVVVAARTALGSLPGETFALLENVLEKNGNKIYHKGSCVLGETPPVVNRAESLPELSARLVSRYKKWTS